jgi:hypothetical protein
LHEASARVGARVRVSNHGISRVLEGIRHYWTGYGGFNRSVRHVRTDVVRWGGWRVGVRAVGRRRGGAAVESGGGG